MSEETKQTVPALPTLEVTRNEVTVKYVSATKKRGATPGELYYTPDPAIKLTDVIKHIGEDSVLSMLVSRWNLYSQRWMAEASLTEDEKPKPFDSAEFLKYAQDFSARGMTIASLNEEIAKLSEAFTEYVSSVEFLSISDADPEVAKSLRKAAIQPRIDRIKELKAAVAARKDKKEDAAAE